MSTDDLSRRVVERSQAPLMLLHGITSSADAWVDVEPLLSDCHDLIVPTAAGHRGGPPLTGRASIAALVDGAERLLDSRGLDRVHVAGNSMGPTPTAWSTCNSVASPAAQSATCT